MSPQEGKRLENRTGGDDDGAVVGETMRLQQVVVIGSSRGLGAALVDELLRQGAQSVVGVARTQIQDVAAGSEWLAGGRYRHVTTDVGRPECVPALLKALGTLAPEPVTVIFNAACFALDVREDGSFDHEAYREVNRVGVDGLGYVLRTFDEHWRVHGGMLVGISSINVWRPPVLARRIAYGASKAYLDMLLRNVALGWAGRVRTVRCHLGHIGDEGRDHGALPAFLKPSYRDAARELVRILGRERVPAEYTYPQIYRWLYRVALAPVSDAFFARVIGALVPARR
jgi:NAD(P)-dependent dehydrogenase (short-subunit alcohol dehydrogenase family)